LVAALAVTAGRTSTADASVKVSWSVSGVQCYRYSVTERRRGVLDLNWLWKLQQQVYWCQSTPGGPVWQGPSAIRSHWENSTWAWGGYDQTYARKLTSPTRWQFYVKASFNGNGAYLVTEHNHPWVRMTIWKNNPQHVAYSASCGC
jgi:hypothetical protein